MWLFTDIEAIQQSQEYHGPDIWQKHEEFGMDILYFTNTPMHLLYLASRNTLEVSLKHFSNKE